MVQDKSKFTKLIDVAYQDSDISRWSRLDRYWTRRSSILKGSVRERRTQIYIKSAAESIGFTSSDMMNRYHLKGVEYGRWVKTVERQDHFCSALLALEDLGQILKTKNLGFDHHVGLAFGARGVAGADAHFEPGTMMINLTKENGASTLAHEYGHAIDYFFGLYMDINHSVPALSGGHLIGSATYGGSKGKYRQLMLAVMDAVLATDSYQYWRKTTTNLDYKCNHTEMFARVFEQWVADELRKAKIVNRYLTKTPDSYSKAPKWYLTEQDKKKVYPSIKALIAEITKAANEK